MSKARVIETVQTLDLVATRKLLDANPALLTVTDRKGRNLLHLACSVSCADLKMPESASARMVTFLLDRGLDVESPMADRDRCTALFFTVARGRNLTPGSSRTEAPT